MRTVRQGRWLKYPDIDWLDDGGTLQGDVFCDIQTTCCQLSVFRVNSSSNNNYDGGDIQRVISALASERSRIDLLDYAIFDDSDLASLGITVQQTKGYPRHGSQRVALRTWRAEGITACTAGKYCVCRYTQTNNKKRDQVGVAKSCKASQLNTAKIDSEKMRADLQPDT